MRAVVRRRATRTERRLRPPGALSPAAAMLRSAFGCLRSHGFSAISTSITNNPDGTTDIEMRATVPPKGHRRMNARPNVDLQLTDTGVLGTMTCSTLRLRAHEAADDPEETILAILREGAALRPGPKFGGEARALLIRDHPETPRQLPLAYALALGQVARRLRDIDARASPRSEPVSVWYARGNTSPTRAARINDRPVRAGTKREHVIFSSRMTAV